MRMKNILAAVAASSLVAAPVMAAPIANPAKSLSVAGARAGTPSKASEKLNGGFGVVGLVILAGVIAIIVIAAIDNDNDDNNSDSN